MELTERKQKILSSVVKSYVASGEPVGSKLIADEIGVSSATVRNEMADLTDLGLLEQPHTSAGRIPSQRGFREYVNCFLKQAALPQNVKSYLDSVLATGAYDREKLLRRAGEALSGATRLASLVGKPGGKTARITAVQFAQISRRTAMLILMSSAGTMRSRIFHCDFDLSADIMRIFFRAFNEKVVGKAVSEITPGFLQSLWVSFGEIAILMSPAIPALLEAAADTVTAEVLLCGQMNLLFYPEFSPAGIRRINAALENAETAASLMEGKSGRVNVFIGSEIGKSQFERASVVSCRYRIGDVDSGGVGVIGPIRMDYPLAASCVAYVSQEVSRMLTVLIREA